MSEIFDLVLFRDALLVIVALVLPIFLVAGLGWRGVIIGSLIMWLAGYLYVRLNLRPFDEGASIALGLWVFGGWLISVIYCCIAYGIRQLLVFGRRASDNRMRYRY